MTAYNHQLTMIVPESAFAGANALAKLFGETPDEPDTFKATSRTHNGTSYAWVQTPVKAGRIPALVAALAAGQPVDVGDAASNALIAASLILDALDADNPPAWAGQTIIALDVPAESLFGAYGITALLQESI
jgi:hypothetical protein